MTLDLIATNVYNSVKAPPNRGFSYVEVWMVGVQVPILVGILEYGIILALQKYCKLKEESVIKVGDHPRASAIQNKEINHDWNEMSQTLDKWTFFGSTLFICLFNIIYWYVTLTIV